MVKIELPKADASFDSCRAYRFDKADDFYNALLNFNDTLNVESDPYYPSAQGRLRWLFRGHWDSNWGITSSAFREGWTRKFLLQSRKKDSFFDNAKGPQIAYLKDIEFIEAEDKETKFRYQIYQELVLLIQFMRIANTLGIECNYTPAFYDYYRKKLHDIFFEGKEDNIEELQKWPDSRILPLMALAQHHGVPTRLLDFTYNRFLAAFFAAFHPFEKRYEEIPKDGDLCVWGFKEENIIDGSFQEVPAPSNRSSNLFSQEGALFLDIKANEIFIKEERWPCLRTMQDSKDPVKLILPQSECKNLLRLLWKDNITPARIMPNPSKVAETLEYNHWLWTEK